MCFRVGSTQSDPQSTPLHQAASKAAVKQQVKQQEAQEVEAVCLRVGAEHSSLYQVSSHTAMRPSVTVLCGLKAD